jgi:hypothetical protein
MKKQAPAQIRAGALKFFQGSMRLPALRGGS